MTIRSKKIDNHNPTAKLTLRRHFLRRYHLQNPPDILDCFAGYSRLWTQLRKEFATKHYTGIELRRIPGRLKMDSLQYLQRQDWTHDIIDLDAYGSPWKHLVAALPNIKQCCTIFLTASMVGLGTHDATLIKFAGIPFSVPSSLHRSIAQYVIRAGLCIPQRYGFQIVEAMEAPNPGGTCRYFGLRLAFPADTAERR